MSLAGTDRQYWEPLTVPSTRMCAVERNPAEVHWWASLFRSIMCDAGLGKVMSGTEKVPEPPADTTETGAAAFENSKLYTRLY